MKCNERGFSLVETMVSVGLAAGLGYVMMTQSEMSSKQQARAGFNQQVNSLTNSIQTELSRSENCTATLRTKTYGNELNPTLVTDIRRGRLDVTGASPVVLDNGSLFKVRAENSNGIYIDSIHLIKRTGDQRKFLRVTFKSGSISDAGVVREKDVLGGDAFSKDILLSTRDNPSNEVISCQSETTNLLAASCLSMPGGEWDNDAGTCVPTEVVTRDDLIPLWITQNGTISTIRPGNSQVKIECKMSNKRCSRRGSDNCNLPACPPYYVKGGEWIEDVDESFGTGVNKKCMKYAYCNFSSPSAGFMVKP